MASMPDEDTDVDDYMTMAVAEPAPAETALQRLRRTRREAEQRGRGKSKTELMAEMAAAREQRLAVSLLADAGNSKGFAIMAKMGFRAGSGLGPADGASAVTEPLPLEIRPDRSGLGKRPQRLEGLVEGGSVEGGGKRPHLDPAAWRERGRRERDDARTERRLAAAMRVAERLEAAPAAPRPLRCVNVLWRGLVRAREAAERERRLRHQLEAGLDSDDDGEAVAGGLPGDEELDQDDPELDAFEAQEPAERLQQLLDFLRQEHRYCFWCGCEYDDDAMQGCPGETEEDHE